jgi:ribosomal RNA-processing protein 9
VIPRAKKGAEGQPPGHSSHILCMAISSDGKYLVRLGWPWGQWEVWVCGMCLWPSSLSPQASGDCSKLILIWEAQSCRHLYTFTGHRDAVSVRTWARLSARPLGVSLLRGPALWGTE